MANIAQAYAKILKEAESERTGAKFAEKLAAYMKSRGHLSLLPRVLKIAERLPNADEAVVTVKSKADLDKLKPRIKASLKKMGTEDRPNVVIDPNVVGGYTARYKGKAVDMSFRSALVDIYQKSIRS